MSKSKKPGSPLQPGSDESENKLSQQETLAQLRQHITGKKHWILVTSEKGQARMQRLYPLVSMGTSGEARITTIELYHLGSHSKINCTVLTMPKALTPVSVLKGLLRVIFGTEFPQEPSDENDLLVLGENDDVRNRLVWCLVTLAEDQARPFSETN